MVRKREVLGQEDLSDIPVAPSQRHPMSGEPIWDAAAVRAMLTAQRQVFSYLTQEANKLLPVFTTAEALGAWREKVRVAIEGGVVDVPATEAEQPFPDVPPPDVDDAGEREPSYSREVLVKAMYAAHDRGYSIGWDHARAAPQPSGPLAAVADAQPLTWNPMSTAPRDNTIVRLLVEFTEHDLADDNTPTVTIGSNNFDNCPDTPEWQFAGWDWCHDCWTQGQGSPIGWLPLLEASQPSANPGPLAALQQAVRIACQIPGSSEPETSRLYRDLHAAITASKEGAPS